VSFWVPGIPAPGGSKRAIPYRGRDGKTHVAVKDMGVRNKDWRATVAQVAESHYQGEPFRGPLAVTFEFVAVRPKGHYTKSGRRLRTSAPMYPTVRPDALKLARSTEDALTGILWADDSQTVQLTTRKVYGPQAGCRVEVVLIESLP
jgi:Holliday junction resolvase RusA-like endonuclease